jgi:predicted phage-related endonuclease
MTFTGRIVEGLDPADRPVWLDWRRTRVGGSDVSAILGISNYGSPWSVWAEKVGLIGDEPSDELMEAGRWLEHAIAPWFSDRTGLHVIGTQAVVEAADDPDRVVHRRRVRRRSARVDGR